MDEVARATKLDDTENLDDYDLKYFSLKMREPCRLRPKYF